MVDRRLTVSQAAKLACAHGPLVLLAAIGAAVGGARLVSPAVAAYAGAAFGFVLVALALRLRLTVTERHGVLVVRNLWRTVRVPTRGVVAVESRSFFWWRALSCPAVVLRSGAKVPLLGAFGLDLVAVEATFPQLNSRRASARSLVDALASAAGAMLQRRPARTDPPKGRARRPGRARIHSRGSPRGH